MVSIIRLVDGTEVVGQIEHEDKNIMLLKDPLQINYRQRSDSLPAIYLHRYIPFSNTHTFEFKQEHIINKVRPLANLEKYYSALLRSINENIDTAINQELASAAMEAGDEELTEEELVKIAMLEKRSLKIALN